MAWTIYIWSFWAIMLGSITALWAMRRQISNTPFWILPNRKLAHAPNQSTCHSASTSTQPTNLTRWRPPHLTTRVAPVSRRVAYAESRRAWCPCARLQARRCLEALGEWINSSDLVSIRKTYHSLYLAITIYAFIQLCNWWPVLLVYIHIDIIILIYLVN